MDSTAYPHILEHIIEQCGSAATLLAFRATSRRCHAIADRRLFRHAVFVDQPYQLPRNALERLVELLHRFKYGTRTATPCFALVLPSSSPIEQDVPRLPLLLMRKVEILDFDSSVHPTPDLHHTLASLGMRPFSYQPAWTGAEYALPIMRRFGLSAGFAFARVLDTTVDFVSPGRRTPEHACEVEYRRAALLPCCTPRYIIHLHWPDGWNPNEVDLTTAHGQYNATSGLGLHIWSQGSQRPDIREATLVFSPHCAPPSRTIIDRVVIMAAGAMVKTIVLDSASFTVVGLDGWLRGVEADEFRDSLRDAAIASWLSRWDSDGTPVPDRLAVAKAYDGIRFTTLEDWWDELGDMKDVFGVWPSSAREGAGAVIPACTWCT